MAKTRELICYSPSRKCQRCGMIGTISNILASTTILKRPKRRGPCARIPVDHLIILTDVRCPERRVEYSRGRAEKSISENDRHSFAREGRRRKEKDKKQKTSFLTAVAEKRGQWHIPHATCTGGTFSHMAGRRSVPECPRIISVECQPTLIRCRGAGHETRLECKSHEGGSGER